jgi:methylated-DNA-protein-cysteine methyltransferase related protein
LSDGLKKETRHPSELFEQVLLTIEQIPEGCVATYGQIAHIVGTGPRQVAQALRSVPEGRSVPWFRVINSAGKVSDHGSQDRQRDLLEAEGVEFEGERVDIEIFGWIPD